MLNIELKNEKQLEQMTDHEIKAYITNLEESIKSIHKKRTPEYLNSNYFLGLACGILADRKCEQSDTYCRKGIFAFKEVLKLLRVDDFARQANILQFLGNMYCIFAQVMNSAKFCHLSIHYHKNALRLLKKNQINFSEEIAGIHNCLGNSYTILAKYENREMNCYHAIDCYNEALKELTAEKSSFEYAKIQNNLGNAYQLLASVKDSENNFKHAIHAYEEALRHIDATKSPNLYRGIFINHQKILNLMKMKWVENRYKKHEVEREFLSPIYEKYDILGEGGYGIVYLVYNHEIDAILALKTFRDAYITRKKERTLFFDEAEKWIRIGKHPYIVQAYFIDEINRRPFIAMEFIPSSRDGCCSLRDYISKELISDEQIARWGIQFCIGIQHAYANGITSHRDIKPENILITPENTLKITDFGLATIIEPEIISKNHSSEYTTPVGTILYRSPEHVQSASMCDERSDIYSFGIVLFEMVTKGGHPFILPSRNPSSDDEDDTGNIIAIQRDTPIPHLKSPFNRIIQKCLMFQPEKRYQHFQDLQENLKKIFEKITGEEFIPISLGQLEFEELINHGTSFDHLGKYEDALICYDRAIAINPEDKNAWANKAFSLVRLKRYTEAIACCDKSIAIDPDFSVAFINKGDALLGLKQFKEAIACYDRALELKPWFVEALIDKSVCLMNMKNYDEAIKCCDIAIDMNPSNPKSYNIKGICLHYKDEYSDAIRCYNQALNLDPSFIQAMINKGLAFGKISDHKNALSCFDKVLEFDKTNAEALEYRSVCEKFIE